MEPLVDTVDEDQCRALGVHDFDLDCPTWKWETLASGIPVSQNLADHLIAVSHAGMRARSFAAASGSVRRPHRVILAKKTSP